MKKKLRDFTIGELKLLKARCEWKEIFPDYYYIVRYALKINKDHISNIFRLKFGKKYNNSKIHKDVLNVLNQEILDTEFEVPSK